MHDALPLSPPHEGSPLPTKRSDRVLMVVNSMHACEAESQTISDRPNKRSLWKAEDRRGVDLSRRKQYIRE